MIRELTGTLSGTEAGAAIVSVGGIGYRVFVTPDTLSKAGRAETVHLFTHLVIRENSHDLYGFSNKDERAFFELLISVSGVGPKSALAILSLAPVDTLRNAVAAGDTSYLTSVSGVGKKSAEKIIVELRDKIETDEGAHGGHAHDADTLEALRSLGYTVKEARGALGEIPADVTDPGERIKAALRILSS